MDSAQTSVSDYSNYRNTCFEAAQDDKAFATFKKNEHYNVILEHSSPEQGYGYLASISLNTPDFLTYLDLFRENDLYGGATLLDFGEKLGKISAATLRYVKVLSDLVFIFGSIKDMRIVEIGGGYGGQCAVISKLYPFKSYTIFDLPEPNALQRRYLKTLNISGVDCLTIDELSEPIECDLIISNYAFSELCRPLADLYLEKCILHAPRGYMTCNHIYPSLYSRDEMRLLLPNALAFPEMPQTHPDNYIMVWKDRNASVTKDPYRQPPVVLRKS